MRKKVNSVKVRTRHTATRRVDSCNGELHCAGLFFLYCTTVYRYIIFLKGLSCTIVRAVFFIAWPVSLITTFKILIYFEEFKFSELWLAFFVDSVVEHEYNIPTFNTFISFIQDHRETMRYMTIQAV